MVIEQCLGINCKLHFIIKGHQTEFPEAMKQQPSHTTLNAFTSNTLPTLKRKKAFVDNSRKMSNTEPNRFILLSIRRSSAKWKKSKYSVTNSQINLYREVFGRIICNILCNN